MENRLRRISACGLRSHDEQTLMAADDGNLVWAGWPRSARGLRVGRTTVGDCEVRRRSCHLVEFRWQASHAARFRQSIARRPRGHVGARTRLVALVALSVDVAV